jgi:transcription-repair coupling factor (superfamily II helicase)
VSFHNDNFPNPAALIAYVEKLGETARLRPDMKLVINRAWANPAARLHGALQLSRGLARAAG